MAYRQYCVLSGVLFALVALAHLLRIVNNVPILVDEYTVPMAFSWFGLVVPGALALWAFRLAGSTGGSS